MRVRTEGGLQSFTSVSDVLTYCNGTSVTTNATGGFRTSGTYRSTSDVVIPGFRQRSKKGSVFINSFYSDYHERSYTLGSGTVNRTGACSGTSVKSQVFHGYGTSLVSTPSLIVPDPDVITSLTTEVYTDAASKPGEPDLMGLVNIKELPKLVGGLTSLTKRMERQISACYRDMVRKNPRATSANLSSFIASNWLEYRYAFVPLYLDSRVILEAVKGPPKPQRKTYRSQGSSSHSDVITTSGSGAYFSCVATQNRTIEYEVRAGFIVTTVTGSVVAKYGLNASSIPSALWEFIPFSFIADWFVNIGSLIRIMSPSVGYTTLGSWTTVKVTQVTDVAIASTWNNISGFTGTCSPDVCRYKRVQVTRTPGGPTGFAIRNLNFDSRSTKRRLLDAAALIRRLLS